MRFSAGTASLIASLCMALLLLSGRPAHVHASEPQAPLVFENDMFSAQLNPRSPRQVAGFYEARGFPRRALESLKGSCFLTVRMRNRSPTVVWLELDNWRFFTGTRELKRLSRADWDSRWRRLALPQANRSTFRWTLLPESRDLRSDEPVGGNVTLPATDTPFAVEASFATGAQKQGPMRTMRIDNVRCARDDSP